MIKLIVGLGNPGLQYQDTRHNVGAWLIHQLASKQQLTLRHETKLRGILTRYDLPPHTSWLFIPDTFMNESGIAVASMAKFYKIAPESILIAHDELDFSPGTVRLKEGGGHGGHNGLRDIIRHIGSDFYRLRIGIGHPGNKNQVTNYVLHPPKANEEKQILTSIDEAAAVIPDLLAGDFAKAMHYLHSD